MSETSRFSQKEPVPDITLGNLTLNTDCYSVLINGRAADLSAFEFQILSFLAHQPNRVLPYNLLIQEVWKSTNREYLKHLHVLVHHLRQKLKYSYPFLIQTVRGRGYGLMHAEDASPSSVEVTAAGRLVRSS